MSTVSTTAKQVYRAAVDAFGGEPKVNRRYDEDESHSVDVLRCADRPVPGPAVYSTLTLHDSPNHLDEQDVRVELMGVAPADVEDYPNLLATAAFNVIKDGWLAAPGVVFPDLLTVYELSSTLRHVLWVEPFSYSSSPPSRSTAVPTSTGCSAYRSAKRSDASCSTTATRRWSNASWTPTSTTGS